MKVSNKKFEVLYIFIIVILLGNISIAAYYNVREDVIENNIHNSNEYKIKDDDFVFTNDEIETLKLVNEYRNKNGLSNLIEFQKLQEVSKLKAEDIVENEYFAHNSPNFGTPFEMLKNNGVDYLIAGENLAGNITPEKAVEAWINSPAHRDNILEKNFKYTGISVIDSPIYGKVFVELFM